MQLIGVDPSFEQARVRRHIQRAERLARRAEVAGLDHLQRLVRQLLLEELVRYRSAGRFPQNPDRPDPTPVFVDAAGTRCAVAHLLDVSGETELVARIARERNFARVQELTDEPRLRAWLAAAGLSVAEAAAIQPRYCVALADCVCGTRTGGPLEYPYPEAASGVIEATLTTEAVTTPTQMARVTKTHGETPGVKAGDEIQVQVGQRYQPALERSVGTRVLAPVRPNDSGVGPGVYQAVPLGSDGDYSCRIGVWEPLKSPPMTVNQYVKAVTSDHCYDILVSYDHAWTRSQDCDGDRVGIFGCGVTPSPAAAPTSLGLLLALVAALVTTRKR